MVILLHMGTAIDCQTSCSSWSNWLSKIMFTGAIWSISDIWLIGGCLLFLLFSCSASYLQHLGMSTSIYKSISSYRWKNVSSSLFPIRLSSEPSTEMPECKFVINLSNILLVVTVSAWVTQDWYWICLKYDDRWFLCLSHTEVEPFWSQPSP